MKKNDVIVIDNFYERPDLIRSLALKADYNIFDGSANFPGAESKKSYYSNEHVKKFEGILGKKINFDPEKFIFGKFRYSKKADSAKTTVHLDWDVDWTAIVYLSLDEDSKGGLGLYKHKLTGIESCPQSSEEFEKYGYSSIYDFDKNLIIPDTKELNNWTMMQEIPIKYNRLVLFRGSKYFHGIRDQFGDDISNARLTQNFFFNERV